MVTGEESGSDRGQRQASRSKSQRKLVFVKSHDAVATMDFHHGHSHFDGEKQRRRAREQAKNQQYPAKRFENTRDVDQLGRQSVLNEHALHGGGRPG
jgi:hypothetical protein